LNWQKAKYAVTVEFLKEVRAELGRTTWPTWKEVRGTTTVVIITVFVFAFFLGVVDIALSSVLQRVLTLFRG
jgi:preprotein translocase subunit SecE